MDLKNTIGVANVMSIFSELSEEAKQLIIKSWIDSGEIGTIHWQNAINNKPKIGIPVYARGGIYKTPLTRMVVWNGENWCYYDCSDEVDTISDFCIPQ